MDRSENNETKKTFKFGVLDIVIIVAVLALIVTSVLRYTAEKGLFYQEKKTVNISFTVKSARYTLYDMLEEGEKVFISDGEQLGILTEISANPAVFYAESGGEIIKTYYPENTKYDLSGTVCCELVDKDGRYVTPGGLHICAGVTVKVQTRTVDMTILVTSVTPAE
ncbi:MAG: DUF4330 family protein [Clostridia bacterium]|nr:DUF4330 family protein [Clostridia bacterium]